MTTNNQTATDAAPAVIPPEREFGWGELIRAHRLYMGLDQRDMARLLEFDRRDYQRIENGRNMCPRGFVTRVERLTDRFDAEVDVVCEAALRDGELAVLVDPTGCPWDRNVAGRAALLVRPDATITLVRQE